MDLAVEVASNNFNIPEFLEQAGYGKQSNVFFGIVEGTPYVIKIVVLPSNSNSEDLNHLHEMHRQYIELLKSSKIPFRVLYPNSDDFSLVSKLPNSDKNRCVYYMTKEPAILNPNLRAQLVESISSQEDYKAIIELLLDSLLNIPPLFKGPYDTLNRLVSVPMDYKPANFVFDENGELVFVDTFGPKLYTEDYQSLQQVPLIQDLDQDSLFKLCANIDYMIGRLYRILLFLDVKNSIFRYDEEKEIVLRDLFKRKLLEAKQDGLLSDNLYEEIVRALETNFPEVQELYNKRELDSQSQNRADNI